MLPTKRGKCIEWPPDPVSTLRAGGNPNPADPIGLVGDTACLAHKGHDAPGDQFPHLSWLSGAAGKQEGLSLLEEDGLRLGRQGQQASPGQGAVHVPCPGAGELKATSFLEASAFSTCPQDCEGRRPCPPSFSASPNNTSCSVPPTPALWAMCPLPATARDPRQLGPTSAPPPHNKTPSSGRSVAQSHKRLPLQVKKCLKWC